MGGPLSIPAGQREADDDEYAEAEDEAPGKLTLMTGKTVAGASSGNRKQSQLLRGPGKRKRPSQGGETVVATGPASKRVKGAKKAGFSTGAGNPFSKSKISSRIRSKSKSPTSAGFSLRRSPRRQSAGARGSNADFDDEEDEDAEMESDLGFVQSPAKPLISRSSSTVQKLLPKGRMVTEAMEIKSKAANDRHR